MFRELCYKRPSHEEQQILVIARMPCHAHMFRRTEVWVASAEVFRSLVEERLSVRESFAVATPASRDYIMERCMQILRWCERGCAIRLAEPRGVS
jgi:hypothetical protein